MMWAMTREGKKESEKSQEGKTKRTCFEGCIGYRVHKEGGNKDDAKILI